MNTKIPNIADARLERDIAAAISDSLKFCADGMLCESTAAFQRARELISQRTPEQVARMEGSWGVLK